MEKCNDLPPQQSLAVSLYLKSMNKTQAAKDAGYSTTSVFENPSVKAAINKQLTIRAERLRVGADWVLSEIVKLYHRTTQTEKVLDRDGNPTGEYKFDASNAVKLLALAGRHVDVKAWDVPLDTRADDAEVMARLLRGRQRMTENKLSIDSDDDFLDDEKSSQDELPNFLEPITYQGEPDTLAAPLSIEHESLTEPYEPAEYVSEAVHEIESSPEEKLAVLMERWATGKPAGKK